MMFLTRVPVLATPLLCDILQDKVESLPVVLKNSNQEMVTLLMNDKDAYRNITMSKELNRL